MNERSADPADLAACDAEVLTALHSYSFPLRTLPIVAAALRRAGVTPPAPPVCLARSGRDGTFDVTAAYPTAGPVSLGAPFVVAELPAGRAVQALHVGPWSTMLFTYDRLSEWLTAHGVLNVAPASAALRRARSSIIRQLSNSTGVISVRGRAGRDHGPFRRARPALPPRPGRV